MPKPFRVLTLALTVGAVSMALLAQSPEAAAQKAEKAEKTEKSDKAGKAAKDAPAKKAAAKAADAAPATPASAWAVTCSDRGQATFKCEMTQTLIDEKTRGPIVVLSVTRDGPATALVLRVPHGVYLPAGVSVKIDQTEPKKLAFQRSDAAGVYAGLPLDEKSIEAMSRGRTLALGLELGPGKSLELPARLEGFGPALQRLVSTR